MRKIIVFFSFFFASVMLLTACGGQSTTSTSKKTIIMGSKNFTESLILGEIYSLVLENNGYHVERKLNLGGTMVAHEAIKSGQIDMYPEYTGTGLINILHQTPKTDEKEVYDIVSSGYKKQWNLVWLKPAEANDSQGIVVSNAISNKYNLHTLSQLAQLAPQLRLASVPEFQERADGLPGLQKFYGGFNFKNIKMYDYGIKYRVLQNNEADVTVGFTTDGALTQKDLVLLQDDKKFWPPYQVCPEIRGDILEKDPQIADVINNATSKLTTEKLQALNAEVDINKREYADVAKEFCKQAGLISAK